MNAKQIWTEKNNAGKGYGPDADSIEEVIADLKNNYEGEVISMGHDSDDVVTVLCGDGEYVLIGDANGGPWCVKATAEEMGLA